jgi:hypothetical protein
MFRRLLMRRWKHSYRDLGQETGYISKGKWLQIHHCRHVLTTVTVWCNSTRQLVSPAGVVSICGRHSGDLPTSDLGCRPTGRNRLDLGEAIGILLEEVRKLQHDGSSLGARKLAIVAFQSCSSGVDGGVDVFGSGDLDIGCDLGLIERVDKI